MNTLDADGVGLSVVGSLPVSEKFSVFAKVGAQAWDADATGTALSFIDDDSGENAFYGVGGEYQINDQFRIRLDYESYELDELDIETTSLSASFNF